MTKAIARAAMILAASCCWQAYGDPVLTLDPASGDIGGSPGATIGWGYTITNDTGYYLLPVYSFFCEAGEDPQFTACGPDLGASTYTDYIATYQDTVVGASIPPTGLSGTFDSSLGTGFGAYTIDPAASVGSQDSGTLVLEYEEYSTDPLTDPSAVQENTGEGSSAMESLRCPRLQA